MTAFPTPDDNLRFRMAFASLKGVNRLNAQRLLDLFGSEEAFFSMSDTELSARMGKKLAIFSRDYRRDILSEAEREMEFVRHNSIKPIYFTDEKYPERLSLCDDAPVMLYGCGDCGLNRSVVISIVGTRHATPYGVDFVDHLVKDLAAELEDVVIVSGLAYGIDAAAHKAALKNDVATVAVLAHGLNMIYPASHRGLAADIVHKGGMLVTDYTSVDKVHKGNFLARNRIVAGLADCTLVVESASKGGALVTARIASDYGREVFAVPGRTSDPYSAGCLKLIASNVASLVTDADSLIDACRWVRKARKEGVQKQLFNEPTPLEKDIMNHIIACPDATTGEMSVNLNIPVGTLMALLIDMEFRDLIISVPGGRYQLANN